MQKIKHLTTIRKELLNKAIKEYLANHPEEIGELNEKEAETGVVTIQTTTGVYFEGEVLPGPTWPGWKEIPIGEHKPGYWVVGTKCSWRGCFSNSINHVPACEEEIKPYQYNGGKYEQYCCDLHSIYNDSKNTIEQLQDRISITSGESWTSPINIHWFSVMVKLLEKGATLAEVYKALPAGTLHKTVAMFNHPIVLEKYPKCYTQEFIDAIKNYRKPKPRLTRIAQEEMLRRGVSEESMSFLYGILVSELREALDELRKEQKENNGNEKNKS